MIINLRGTHGSGKSTVVRSIIDRYKGLPLHDVKGKIEGYCMQSPYGGIMVVGPYNTPCGGCDRIQPYADIWPRVEDYIKRAEHVIFEGALVSTSYGTIGKFSEAYGDQFVFACLDTPVELCLDRVRARREERGNTKPLNPDQTVTKHRNIYNMCLKIRDTYKRRVVFIDHRKPVPQILGLLKNAPRSVWKAVDSYW